MSSRLPTTVLRSRGLRAAWIGLAVSLASSSLPAAAVVPSAAVAKIQSAASADLVVLDGGFDAGLREGMVCRLTRGSAEIGEVVLVEVRPAASTALIAGLAPKQSIRRGDTARAKILKT